MAWIAEELGAEVLPVETDDGWGITGNLAGYDFPVCRFLPHRTVGEGLFMAVLRKTSDDGEAETGGRKRNRQNKDKGKKGGRNPLKTSREMENWLLNPERYALMVDGEEAVAFPGAFLDLYELFKSRLKVLHAGIILGEWKGKDWQPGHSLAMNVECNGTAFPQAELTYEQAVAYLRKEAVALFPDTPRGYVLVTYHGRPLGFVKNIGNRANNLYPQEWRIRSGYLPESAVWIL